MLMQIAEETSGKACGSESQYQGTYEEYQCDFPQHKAVSMISLTTV
jgi:hypothetical protein